MMSNRSRHVKLLNLAECFRSQKEFEKRYDEKWKTYYIISSKVFNKDKLPKDENEKIVPSRKKITEDITKEILNTIDADFHKLP